MPNRSAVVFGAGRIARGFVGHLLGLDGYQMTFVDVSPEIVAALNDVGRYTVHIMDAPEKSSVVEGVSALLPDAPELASRLDEAEIVFVSVGGANLPSVADALAAGLAQRLSRPDSELNIIVCENWPAAGKTLRDALTASWARMGVPYPEGRIGVAESTILRSAVDATTEQLAIDPLAKQSQDYWSLPVDADALVTELTGPRHVEAVPHFQHALQRKLFTYNGGNATISYIGIEKGYSLLSEAANDPEIEAIVRGFYAETTAGLVHAYGLDLEDQRVFAEEALHKFQDEGIIDPLVRQVRDPMRKLGPNDRLVGAALLAMDAGVVPDNTAVAIAAALRYRDDGDPSASAMAQLIDALGYGDALAEITGLTREHPLIDLVMSKFLADRRDYAAPRGRISVAAHWCTSKISCRAR